MAVERPRSAPPHRATMDLLDHVTAHSVDEDYAQVSRRRGPDERRPGAGGLTTLLVVGLFGLLVATAAVQTSRNAAAVQTGRSELITQIEARTARLDARRERIVDLRREVDALQRRSLRTTARGRLLAARLERLGGVTGHLPVTGPGVRVVVDDAPDATGPEQQVLDKDLQKLVNALWASGAEAVAVNGQRLTNLTSIRLAGSAITVNAVSLSRPYVVAAIGNPDTIPARFVETDHGAEWLDVQVAVYGLQFDMTSEESLSLPAANRLTLRYVTVPERSR